MQIRKYQSSDCREMTELFYETVHTVNLRDYSAEQADAWAPGNPDTDQWDRSFLEHYSIVAVEDGRIVGFGDIDESGYLDRLYVHKDYQRQGIGAALCDRLENHVSGKIEVHASITAKPFFENRGYRTVKKQQVERKGIFLTNYVMEKR